MNDLQSSGTIEEIGGVLERGAAAGWMEKSSHRMDGQLSNFFFSGGRMDEQSLVGAFISKWPFFCPTCLLQARKSEVYKKANHHGPQPCDSTQIFLPLSRLSPLHSHRIVLHFVCGGKEGGGGGGGAREKVLRGGGGGPVTPLSHTIFFLSFWMISSLCLVL